MLRAESRWSLLAVPLLLGIGLVAGILRESVLAYVFGTGPQVEVFRVASGLPMILSEGLAVSFVSALVIVLLRLRGPQGLWTTVWAVSIVAILTTLAGVLTMPIQAALLAPGFGSADRETLTSAGRICWVANGALLLSYALRAAMSARWRSWPGAAGPLLRNGTFIVVVLGLAQLSLLTAYSASLGVLLAAVLVFVSYSAIWWLAPVRHLDHDSRFMRKDWAAVFPLTLSLVTITFSQILVSGGRIVDRMATSLAPQGVLASVEYSYAITMALASIVATSLNLVLAPRVARTLVSHGKIDRAHKKIVVMVIAAALLLGVLLAIWGWPIVGLVYERGAFDAAATMSTAAVFSIQAIAFGPLIGSLLLTQLLILLGGHRLLILSAAVKLGVKTLALWLLMAAGASAQVAVATSFCIAEAVFCIALMVSLFARRKSRELSSKDWLVA